MKRQIAVAIVGPSNSGKTTIVEKLLALAKSKGLKVAAVKHAPHGFELDRRDSDTDRMASAGADAVAVIGKDETFIRIKTVFDPPSILSFLRDYDLVLFEGFKKSDLPKIEVVARNKSRLKPKPSNVIAEVGDTPGVIIPSFKPDEIDGILQFILKSVS